MSDEMDAFLRELAAYYLPDCERVVIRTQSEADEVNSTRPMDWEPLRVGDCYMRRVEKRLRLH